MWEGPYASVLVGPLQNEKFLAHFQIPAEAELNRPVGNHLCVANVVLNSLIDAANFRVRADQAVAADLAGQKIAAYFEACQAFAVAEIEIVVDQYFCLEVLQYDLSFQLDLLLDFVVVAAAEGVEPNDKVDIVDSRDFA